MIDKPYSEACVRNQQPILAVIQPFLTHKTHVLEIGSGTGQHAVYFSQQLPHLTWQTSDQKQYHSGIRAWLSEAKQSNLLDPLELDVTQQAHWPNKTYDAVYSANTAHIMPWRAVEQFIPGVGKLLEKDGVFLLYGPFKYNGEFTSQSNQRFDVSLKAQKSSMGIRDFEAILQLANQAGLALIKDYSMPANNQLLVFKAS
ncbi:DUF938 domain-containing protein [Aliikangiella maris]|uniref:DUF938 domain-containing protein n=2 Tax=Aliikangiella maris TaxID=3162458 RepID=A0ABV2BVX3_9GAMM